MVRMTAAPSSVTPFRICFVCTGNICRSPMAESVFRARVEEAGLGEAVVVDSAGTDSWHEGDRADARTVAVLSAAGYEQDASGHVARQFLASWFDRLDLVIALDGGHLRALRRLARTPEEAARIRLLRDFDPEAVAEGGDLAVPDPYYGDMGGFEECLGMCEAAADGLLAAVRDGLDQRAGQPRRAPVR